MSAPPISERHKPHFHRQAPVKEPVRCATTANITISTALNNGDSLDGVTLATGDRVLVKNQSTGSQNGIYVVGATPVRAYDLSVDDPAYGFLVYVIDGTTNGGKVFYCTNTSAPTLGTTSLTFAEFTSGALTDHTHAATGSGSNGGGATLSPGTLNLPTATSPAQTSDGQAVWDSDDDVLTIGDGSSRKTFGYLGSTTPASDSGSGAAGTSKETSRADHVHPAGAGSGTLTTVEEVDGSPTDSAVTKLVFPNGTLSIVGHVATYTPAGGGGGGITGSKPVQEKAGSDTSNASSFSLTLGATPTNGNVLILCSSRDNTGTISSISQTNVTWTQLAAYNANGPSVEIWKGVVSASAGTGITVNYSNGSFSYCSVSEWAGVAGTLDQSATFHGTAATAGSRRLLPYLVPSTSPVLVVGCVACDNMTAGMDAIFGPLMFFEGITRDATTRAGHAAGFAWWGQSPIHGIASGGSSNNVSAVMVSVT